MVNNSTNINKTNIHLSPHDSWLKTIDHTKDRRMRRWKCNSWFWERHKHVTGLNQLMGSQPSHSDNWIYNNTGMWSLKVKWILSCFYRLFMIYITGWVSNNQEGLEPINRFNTATFVCLFQSRTWIFNVIWCGIFYIQWFVKRGACSFCWIWCTNNCFSISLFKLSFRN